MTKEDIYSSVIGGVSSAFGMVVGLIDVKSIFNAVLIAIVGTATGYFTRKILMKWFPKK